MTDVWARYLQAVQHLHDVARRIAAIGVKKNPSQEELDSIAGLFADENAAERAVWEAAQAGRAALRSLRSAKGQTKG